MLRSKRYLVFTASDFLFTEWTRKRKIEHKITVSDHNCQLTTFIRLWLPIIESMLKGFEQWQIMFNCTVGDVTIQSLRAVRCFCALSGPPPRLYVN